MCGICGIITQDQDSVIEPVLARMVARLRHRGPDDQGTWLESGVGLGQSRLSIIDLSPLGHQPMASPSRDWIITYNGEVYNFVSLRRELEAAGHSFLGRSDTEVIAVGLDEWGFERTLTRLRGMFALAAWRRSTQQLFLARDRLGQKPLFFGFCGSQFVFGSELRILQEVTPRPSVSRFGAALMLRYNCVPAPQTIYSGISTLMPGCSLVYSRVNHSVSPQQRYWRPPIGVAASRDVLDLEEFRSRLEEAVQLRMVSDVPIGSFLSGGIDSTLVTALMQKLSNRPVKTFTAGFESAVYDESGPARAIASYLGTEHTELVVSERDAIELVPRLGEVYDEPFADPSQVPTTLLSLLTRKHVTVALSGDGGDELFRGYNRHVWLPRLDRVFNLIPYPLRRLLAHGLNSPMALALLRILAEHGLVRTRLLRDKLRKLGALLEARDFRDRYRALLSDWSEPVVRGVGHNFVDELSEVSSDLSVDDQLALADYTFYLPNEVLVKVDRASMHASLEVRSPFLDHQLIEYCAGFSHEQNVSGRKGKRLLRRALSSHVPSELFERPKMGFAAPIRKWLRGDLRDWASDLLATAWVRDGELVDPVPVDAAWRSLQEGRSDTSHKIWNVLALVSWLEANCGD